MSGYPNLNQYDYQQHTGAVENKNNPNQLIYTANSRQHLSPPHAPQKTRYVQEQKQIEPKKGVNTRNQQGQGQHKAQGRQNIYKNKRQQYEDEQSRWEKLLAEAQIKARLKQNLIKIQQQKNYQILKRLDQVNNFQKNQQETLQKSKAQQVRKADKILRLENQKEFAQNKQYQIKNQIQSLSKELLLIPKRIDRLNSQLAASDYYDQRRIERQKYQLSQQFQRQSSQLQAINLKCYNLQEKQQKQESQRKQLQTSRKQNDTKFYYIANLKAEKDRIKSKMNQLKDKYLIILSVDKGQERKFFVPGQMTIRQLKQSIFEQHTQELLPQLMVLQSKYSKSFDSNQRIMQVFSSKKVQLKLRKAEVWQLQGFRSYKDKTDKILGQVGVVQMKCKHQFSRTVMKGVIDYQINKLKQTQFFCPNLTDQERLCKQQFSLKQCQLIAGYSKSQWDDILEKLSRNQIYKQNT